MACRHAPPGLAVLYREQYVGHWVTVECSLAYLSAVLAVGMDISFQSGLNSCLEHRTVCRELLAPATEIAVCVACIAGV
jgi:hypothetical protein